MYCRHCGNQLPDSAKFCNRCGNSVTDVDTSTIREEPATTIPPDYPRPSADTSTQQPPYQDTPTSRPESTRYTAGNHTMNTTRPRAKTRNVVIGILAGIVVVGLAVVFGIRAANENAMRNNIPPMIYESSEEDVISYYDQVMPYPHSHDLGYSYGGDFTTFELTKGDDANTFHVKGELFVTDNSREDRPDYKIYIDGTVTTNFFRSEYSAEWGYRVEDPPVVQKEPEPQQNQWESDWASDDLKDVYRWIEGEYHQAHHYTLTMYLTISEEDTSEAMAIYFLFCLNDEILGDGYLFYAGGDDMPIFEGALNSTWEPVSIEYDGYNFIVNCPALDIEDVSFFLD